MSSGKTIRLRSDAMHSSHGGRIRTLYDSDENRKQAFNKNAAHDSKPLDARGPTASSSPSSSSRITPPITSLRKSDYSVVRSASSSAEVGIRNRDQAKADSVGGTRTSAAREWPISSERQECSSTTPNSPRSDSGSSSASVEHATGRDLDRLRTIAAEGHARRCERIQEQKVNGSMSEEHTTLSEHTHADKEVNRAQAKRAAKRKRACADEEEVDELCQDRTADHTDAHEMRSLSKENMVDGNHNDHHSPSGSTDDESLTSLSSFSQASACRAPSFRRPASATVRIETTTASFSEDGSATTLMGSATSLEDHLAPTSPDSEAKTCDGLIKVTDDEEEGVGKQNNDRLTAKCLAPNSDRTANRVSTPDHSSPRASRASHAKALASPVSQAGVKDANGTIVVPNTAAPAPQYTVTLLSGAPQRKSCDRCFRMKTKCSRAGPGASSDGPCEGCVRRGFGHDCVTSRPDFPHPRITLAKRPRREFNGTTIVPVDAASKGAISASPSSRVRAVQWSRQHTQFAAANHAAATAGAGAATARHDERSRITTASVMPVPPMATTTRADSGGLHESAHSDARLTYVDSTSSGAYSGHSRQSDHVSHSRQSDHSGHSRQTDHAAHLPYDHSFRSYPPSLIDEHKIHRTSSSIYANAKAPRDERGDVCHHIDAMHRSLHDAHVQRDGMRPLSLSSCLRAIHTADLHEMAIVITDELARRATPHFPSSSMKIPSASRYNERA